MTTTLGEAVITVNADAAQFGPQLSRDIQKMSRGIAAPITKAFSEAGKAITSTISTSAQIAAGATAAIGTAAISAGIQYNRLGQRVTAALTTVLGTRDAAREMIDDLKEFGKTSPFPRQVFIEGTQVLAGFGLEAEKIIPLFDSLQDAVAATGGNAENLTQIIDVFADIQGQGKLTGDALQRLGIQGIDAAAIIGKEMGKTGAEIRDEISKGAIDATKAIDILTKGLGEKFGGAADNLKNTFEGATDRVKGALRDIGSSIVQSFIGFEGGGVAVTGANRIADTLRSLEKTVVPVIAKLVAQFADKLGPAIDKVATIISSINGDSISGLLDKLKDFGPIIAAVGAGLTTAFAGNIPIVGQFLGGLNPIVVAMGALIASSPELREAFTDAFGQITEAVQPVLGVVGDLVKGLAGPLSDVVASLAPVIANVVESLAGALKTIGPLIPDLVAAFGELLTAVVKIVGSGIVALFDALTPVVAALVPVLTQIASTLADLFSSEAFAGALTTISSLLTQVGQALAEVFSSDAVTETIATLGVILGQLGVAAGEVLAALSPLVPALLDVVKALLPLLPALADIALSLLPALVPLLAALTPIIQVVAVTVTALTPLINGLAKAFAFIASKPVLPALIALGLAFLPVLGTTAAVTLAVVAATAALVSAFKLLKKAIEAIDFGAIGDAFKDAGEFIGEFFDILSGDFVDVAKDAFKAVGKAVTKGFKSLAKLFDKALENVLDLVGDFAVAYVKVYAGLGRLVVRALAGFGSAVLRVFEAAGRAILKGAELLLTGYVKLYYELPKRVVTALAGLAPALVGAVTKAFSALGKATTTAITNYVKLYAGVVTKVAGALAGLSKALVGVFSKAFSAVASTISNGISKAVALIKAIPRRFLDGLGNLARTLGRPVRAAAEAIVDAFEAVPGRIAGLAKSFAKAGKKVLDALFTAFTKTGDFATGIAKSIGNAIIDAINAAIRAFNDLGDVTINVLGFKRKIGIPDIPLLPQFADGGIVKKATAAVIGEDGAEAILPLTKPDRMRQILNSPEVAKAIAKALPADIGGLISNANAQALRQLTTVAQLQTVNQFQPIAKVAAPGGGIDDRGVDRIVSAIRGRPTREIHAPVTQHINVPAQNPHVLASVLQNRLQGAIR